jgi:hypothetical protein
MGEYVTGIVIGEVRQRVPLVGNTGKSIEM